MEDQIIQANSNKKHTVLCVDDEENILKALRRVLRKEHYNLLIARSGKEGLEIFKTNDIHLVLSDQKMPEMSGTEFFAEIKDLYPDTIRIILSGYTEISSITSSINQGNIYKFFHKPWNDENLKLEIQKALEQYDLIQANRDLTQTVLEQNEALKTINDSLESTVKERTKTLELKNKALELSQAVLEELPYPVLCVGSDNLIALVNRKMNDLSMQAGKNLCIGEQINDFFDIKIMESLGKVLDSGLATIKTDQVIFGEKYDIYMSPMSGNFRGQGIIISIFAK